MVVQISLSFSFGYFSFSLFLSAALRAARPQGRQVARMMGRQGRQVMHHPCVALRAAGPPAGALRAAYPPISPSGARKKYPLWGSFRRKNTPYGQISRQFYLFFVSFSLISRHF